VSISGVESRKERTSRLSWAGGGRRKRDSEEAVTLEKGIQTDDFAGAGNLDRRVEL
jgi:hypothetical protein